MRRSGKAITPSRGTADDTTESISIKRWCLSVRESVPLCVDRPIRVMVER